MLNFHNITCAFKFICELLRSPLIHLFQNFPRFSYISLLFLSSFHIRVTFATNDLTRSPCSVRVAFSRLVKRRWNVKVACSYVKAFSHSFSNICRVECRWLAALECRIRGKSGWNSGSIGVDASSRL